MGKLIEIAPLLRVKAKIASVRWRLAYRYPWGNLLATGSGYISQ